MMNINNSELTTLIIVCSKTIPISLKLKASRRNNERLCAIRSNREYNMNQLIPILLIEGSSLGFISFLLVIPLITYGRKKAINTVAAALSPGVPLKRSTVIPVTKASNSSCHF